MEISKVFTFEAAHWLPRHPGKCRKLHGHSYTLEVFVEGPVDSETQFVLDYGDLKTMVKPIVDRFDHELLNCFIVYPSAENIATHIAHLLIPSLQIDKINRFVVLIRETANTSAKWDSKSREDWARLDDGGAGKWRSPSSLWGYKEGIVPLLKPDDTLGDTLHRMIVDTYATAEENYAVYETALTKAKQLEMYRDSLSSASALLDTLRTGKPQ